MSFAELVLAIAMEAAGPLDAEVELAATSRNRRAANELELHRDACAVCREHRPCDRVTELETNLIMTWGKEQTDYEWAAANAQSAQWGTD